MSQSVADDVDELVGAVASERDLAGATVPPGMTDVGCDESAAPISADGAVFVTPDGAWVREGSPEFFIALGDTDPDYDAPLFAIKNFGFIAVHVMPKTLVDIKLHPRNVTSAALESILCLLSPIKSALFRISYLKGNWVMEAASSPAQTICRLSEICAAEGVGVPRCGSGSRIH